VNPLHCSEVNFTPFANLFLFLHRACLMFLSYAGLLAASLSSGASFSPPALSDAPRVLAAGRGSDLRFPRTRSAEVEEDDDYGSEPKRAAESAPGEEPELEVASTSKPSRTWMPVVIASGALVAGGVTCWGLAASSHSKLSGGDSAVRSMNDLDASISRGKRLEQAGWGLTGVGLVGLGVGFVLALTSSSASSDAADDGYETSANLTVTRGGGMAAVFSGPLP
jgi:tetrahydromethanopterin S-methyltransferase subunit F